MHENIALSRAHMGQNKKEGGRGRSNLRRLWRLLLNLSAKSYIENGGNELVEETFDERAN